MSYDIFVDSLLAGNSSSTKMSCRWNVCTQDTNLLLSNIKDVVEVGAILLVDGSRRRRFGYILFIVQDVQLGNFTQILNATGIAPVSSSHIIE
jgi:hypothetical protein